MLFAIRIFFGFSVINCCCAYTYNDTDRLLDDLFKRSHYNKNIRPVFNQSEAITVNFTHLLRSIKNIDLRNGDFLTTSAIRLSWRDELLTWDPNDYGGIEIISFPEETFWHPNIITSEGGDNDGLKISESGYSFTWGTYTGQMIKIIAGYIQSTCTIRSTYYPFDSHNCIIIYACQRYTGRELILTHVREDDILHMYTENSEWIITNVGATKSAFSHHGLGGTISYVQVSINVTRRPAFEILSLHVPAVLLSDLSPVACLIPVKSGERLSFLITLFMSLVFMFTVYISEMPRDSLTLPYVSGLFIAMLALNTLNTMWTVFIMRLGSYSTDEHPIPRPLMCLLSGCSKRRSSKVGDIPDDTSDDEGRSKQKHEADTKEVDWMDACRLLDKIAFVVQSFFVLTLMILYLCIYIRSLSDS